MDSEACLCSACEVLFRRRGPSTTSTGRRTWRTSWRVAVPRTTWWKIGATCKAMQSNAKQCKAIEYIHIYIYGDLHEAWPVRGYRGPGGRSVSFAYPTPRGSLLFSSFSSSLIFRTRFLPTCACCGATGSTGNLRAAPASFSSSWP